MGARREVDAAERLDGANGRVDERLRVGRRIGAVQRLGPRTAERHQLMFALVAHQELNN